MKTRIVNLLRAVKRNNKKTVCILITFGFALISIFCFSSSHLRVVESFRDFGLSVGYCFNPEIAPTVNTLSEMNLQNLGVLPGNFELFAVKLKLYGKLLITKTSLQYYGLHVADVLLWITYILLLFLPLLMILAITSVILIMRKNNKYNRDTKPLKVIKLLADYTYIPAKNWTLSFLSYVKEHKKYIAIWVCIWAFNFNFLTIFIEFIAYYFYFLISLDIGNIYIQCYKLLLDLSVPIVSIPVVLWAFIVLGVFLAYRHYHSMKLLKKLEEKDEEQVRELPISSLICGPMGTKKTTFLTDIAITGNKIFRDVAYEKLIENDMKFPSFPWINLELCVRRGMDNHLIYNLETCKKFVRYIRTCYERSKDYPELTKKVKSGLVKRYGYNFDNYIFDYDVDRYGFTYDDKHKISNVFDVAETYAQLYFIYVMSCTLLITNYSIRVDDVLKDEGNFPLWDIDFFRTDTKFAEQHSRHSHIIDFDALRIGKKVIEDNRFKDSIDFGIIAITEIGKERGNQFTVKVHKVISDELGIEANQDNDLFNIDVKMCRHKATVDNFPFILFLVDEQRAASLNSDFKELCDVAYISKSSEFKFITPLYAVDELIYLLASKLFKFLYKKERFNKGNNTLFKHTLKKIYYIIRNHYIRAFNMFSASTLTFSVRDSVTDEKGKKRTYKLSKKKIHSSRFATDAWGAYYQEKTARSKVGITDLPEYKETRASMQEIASQHSYFDMDCRQTISK